MSEITSIEFSGDWSNDLAQILKKSFDKADQVQHKLPEYLLKMHGMSGQKYRSLINNLIEIMPNPRYLEVGCHSGSTFCSAIWQNSCKALAIDNWSMFGGPKDQFFRNLEHFSNSNVESSFIESDFRAVDYTSIGKFNVFMFDGPHEQTDQYDGIKLALPALDDTFIMVIDDWNWPGPRNGTIDALEGLDIEVIAGIVINTTDDNTHPNWSHEHSDWHNGYYISVLRKL